MKSQGISFQTKSGHPVNNAAITFISFKRQFTVFFLCFGDVTVSSANILVVTV